MNVNNQGNNGIYRIVNTGSYSITYSSNEYSRHINCVVSMIFSSSLNSIIMNESSLQSHMILRPLKIKSGHPITL